MDHAAALERDGAVGQRQRQVEVVVDDDDRDLVAQLVEALEQLLDDRRREALEGLVEQEHAHVAGERARDRHHLLLAAGEVVGRRASARAMRGKKAKMRSTSQRTPWPVWRLQAAELQVLRHRHAGEEPAPLRHVADAAPRDLGRGQAGDLLAVRA